MRSRDEVVRIAAWSIAVAAGVASSTAVSAAPIIAGDVFISGVDPTTFDASHPNGDVRQFRVAGSTLSTVATYKTSDEIAPGGITFGPGNDLYVTNFAGLLSPSAGSVTAFVGANPQNSLTIGGGPSGPLAGQRPVSVAIDASGNRYVGAAGPLGLGGGDLYRFDAAGALTGQYDIKPVNQAQARGVDWIDLGPDQKTLYYTSFGRQVYRYDLTSGTLTASVFADLPDAGCGTGASVCAAYEIKLLPDGGMLVADTVNIKRLDAAGNVVKTYDDPTTDADFFVSLALDLDGASFWTVDLANNEILRFNLGTAVAADMGNAGDLIMVGGIGVAGEPRQGQAQPPAPTAVPEPAAASLFGLGLLALRLRRRRA